jgi:glycerophosphoryl diester phosphodiesterase
MAGAGKTRPLLLGHRGARSERSIPENTIASFDQALAHGCDGFEFDVRRTADGAAVICHDPDFNHIHIARASIQQCGELPRLKDVIARYCDRAFLDIELKVSGLEKITAALLTRKVPQRGYVVSSFLPEVLQTLHLQAPQIPLGLICEHRHELEQWQKLPITYLIPHRALVNSDLASECKRDGKKILVWTVNSTEEMLRLRDWGVDGIISDETKLLAGTVKIV